MNPLFILFTLLIFYAAPAQAQNVLKAEQELYKIPVGERIHPELQADGLASRGFIYKPRLNITGAYDSNVRGLKNQDDSDYSLSVKPELYLQKKYNAHILNGFFGAELKRFAKLDDENQTNIKSYLRGLFDINSRWSIPAHLSYSSQARSRDLPQSQAISQSPESVQNVEGSLGITRRFNRLSVSAISKVNDITHGDGNALIGGAPIIYSDQDRKVFSGALRTRYEFLRGSDGAPEHVAFFDLKYEDQNYEKNDFVAGTFSGLSGDNKRMGIFGGFETKYKGILFANIGAGFTSVDFNDSGLEDTDLFTLNSEVSYMITPKTNLSFDAYRQINQNNDFIQGFKDSGFALGIDYEARHNLYLGAKAGYGLYDFIGNSREDDNYTSNLTLRYLNSHKLETHLGYKYFKRNSSDQAQDYDRHTILLSLIGKL